MLRLPGLRIAVETELRHIAVPVFPRLYEISGDAVKKGEVGEPMPGGEPQQCEGYWGGYLLGIWGLKEDAP